MAGEIVTTIIGNLTGDPELRFTPSGAAVANFTVACTPRTFDRQSNEWKDGETVFMACSVWRDMAENVTETLSRGMRVVVTGRLKSRSYETKQGEKRTVLEMDVDEVGPSLRYATALVKKTQRSGVQQQGGRQQQGGNWDGQDDPWTTGQPARQGNVVPGSQGPQQGGWGQQPQQGNRTADQGGWGSNPPSYDEPPF